MRMMEKLISGLNEAIQVASAGTGTSPGPRLGLAHSHGRVPGDTPTMIKVKVWKRLAINDYGVEHQQLKAYVRSAWFEKAYATSSAQARDATYVMTQYEDGGVTVAGFGRINYFFLYDGTGDSGHYTATHMLVNLDITKTASVNIALNLGGRFITKGRGKGGGTRGCVDGAMVRRVAQGPGGWSGGWWGGSGRRYQ